MGSTLERSTTPQKEHFEQQCGLGVAVASDYNMLKESDEHRGPDACASDYCQKGSEEQLNGLGAGASGDCNEQRCGPDAAASDYNIQKESEDSCGLDVEASDGHIQESEEQIEARRRRDRPPLSGVVRAAASGLDAEAFDYNIQKNSEELIGLDAGASECEEQQCGLGAAASVCIHMEFDER